MLKSPWARVDPSPWPFLTAIALLAVPVSTVVWLWGGSLYPVVVSMVVVGVPITKWVHDVIIEGTFCGIHTSYVTRCLTTATLLFIVSEGMFFFSLFWAWAHLAWVPSVFMGKQWPPIGIKPIHPFGVPALNLNILVLSSLTLNWANGSLRAGNRESALLVLGVTILLGVGFEGIQLFEYRRAAFSIADSAFGSTFFVLTGFHGFHVIAGLGYLCFCFVRMYYYHFHTGFNIGWVAGVWYWHFVDGIWLLVWLTVYVWGGLGYFSYSWPPWEVDIFTG